MCTLLNLSLSHMHVKVRVVLKLKQAALNPSSLRERRDSNKRPTQLRSFCRFPFSTLTVTNCNPNSHPYNVILQVSFVTVPFSEPIICSLLSDCSDLLKSGHTQSGLYSVNPDGRGHFTVYCDMRTDGGGWTVFQRRQDGSVNFYRGWNDYKVGFGQLTAEFWLGNDKIHRLTAARPSSLRVELEDWNRVKAHAKYGKFNIGD